MVIKYFTIIILVAFATFNANATNFYPLSKAEKLVKSALKEKDIEIIGEVEVKESNPNNRNIVIYRCSRKNGGDEFYAVFTHAKGRYDMFDYLMIADKEFVISKIKVVKYRSEHGGEIASKKWLEQFVNYSSGDLYYEDQISALSGATISAMSITRDIPKTLKILKNSCK
jgi:Na+-translocating ferredoxin:NAD+ oxidoreductase RnfG subunit